MIASELEAVQRNHYQQYVVFHCWSEAAGNRTCELRACLIGGKIFVQEWGGRCCGVQHLVAQRDVRDEEWPLIARKAIALHAPQRLI